MRLLGKEKLHYFILAHPDAKIWTEAWIAEVEGNRWRKPQDIKDRYASASFLKGNIVIFNIRGNNYRLEVKIAYKTGNIIVQWIGTHAEYTKRYK